MRLKNGLPKVILVRPKCVLVRAKRGRREGGARLLATCPWLLLPFPPMGAYGLWSGLAAGSMRTMDLSGVPAAVWLLAPVNVTRPLGGPWSRPKEPRAQRTWLAVVWERSWPKRKGQLFC
jgi:hypothetical protein